MKKYVRIMGFVFAIFSCFLLASCGKRQDAGAITTAPSAVVEEKTITKIEMAESPKTDYEQYQEIDIASGKIKVFYSDNTEEVINITSEMISGNTDTIGENAISVTYEGFKTEYRINVDLRTLTFSSTGYTGIFDGEEHQITINNINEGDKVTYSYDGLEYFDFIPSFVEAGLYEISYRVERENYKPFEGKETVSIKMFDVDGVWISPENDCAIVPLNEIYQDEELEEMFNMTDCTPAVVITEKENAGMLRYGADGKLYIDFSDSLYSSKLITINDNSITYDGKEYSKAEKADLGISGFYSTGGYVAHTNGDSFNFDSESYAKGGFEGFAYQLNNKNYIIFSDGSIVCVEEVSNGFKISSDSESGVLNGNNEMTFVKEVFDVESGIYASGDNYLYIDFENNVVAANFYAKASIVLIKEGKAILSNGIEMVLTTEGDVSCGETTYSFVANVKSVNSDKYYIATNINRFSRTEFGLKLTPTKAIFYNKGKIGGSFSASYKEYEYVLDDKGNLYYYDDGSYRRFDFDDNYVEIDFSKATALYDGMVDEIKYDEDFDHKVYYFTPTEAKRYFFNIYDSGVSIFAFKDSFYSKTPIFDSFVKEEFGKKQYYIVVNEDIEVDNDVEIEFYSEPKLIENCLLMDKNTATFYEIVDGNVYIVVGEKRRNLPLLYLELNNTYLFNYADYSCTLMLGKDGKMAHLHIFDENTYSEKIIELEVLKEYNGSSYNGNSYSDENADFVMSFDNNVCVFLNYIIDELSTIYVYNDIYVICSNGKYEYLKYKNNGDEEGFYFYDITTNEEDAFKNPILKLDPVIKEGIYFNETSNTFVWFDGNIINVYDNGYYCSSTYFEDFAGYIYFKCQDSFDYLASSDGQLLDKSDNPLTEKVFGELDENFVGKKYFADDACFNVLSNGIVLVNHPNDGFNIIFADDASFTEDGGKYYFNENELIPLEIEELSEFDYSGYTEITINIESNDNYFIMSNTKEYDYANFILTDEIGNPILDGCLFYIQQIYLEKGTYKMLYCPYGEYSDTDSMMILSLKDFNDMVKNKVFYSEYGEFRLHINALGVVEITYYDVEKNAIFDVIYDYLFDLDLPSNLYRELDNGEVIGLGYCDGQFFVSYEPEEMGLAISTAFDHSNREITGVYISNDNRIISEVKFDGLSKIYIDNGVYSGKAFAVEGGIVILSKYCTLHLLTYEESVDLAYEGSCIWTTYTIPGEETYVLKDLSLTSSYLVLDKSGKYYVDGSMKGYWSIKNEELYLVDEFGKRNIYNIETTEDVVKYYDSDNNECYELVKNIQQSDEEFAYNGLWVYLSSDQNCGIKITKGLLEVQFNPFDANDTDLNIKYTFDAEKLESEGKTKLYYVNGVESEYVLSFVKVNGIEHLEIKDDLESIIEFYRIENISTRLYLEEKNITDINQKVIINSALVFDLKGNEVLYISSPLGEFPNCYYIFNEQQELIDIVYYRDHDGSLLVGGMDELDLRKYSGKIYIVYDARIVTLNFFVTDNCMLNSMLMNETGMTFEKTILFFNEQIENELTRRGTYGEICCYDPVNEMLFNKFGYAINCTPIRSGNIKGITLIPSIIID